MSDAYVGTVQSFAFNFAPRGWVTCSGQLLPLNQQQTLFSLIGTYYGGNGTTNFAVPNLNGAVIVGTGNAQAGGNYAIGQVGGTPQVTLTQANLPVRGGGGEGVTVNNADHSTPTATSVLGKASTTTGDEIYIYAPDSAPISALSPKSLPGLGGSSTPVSIMQPYVAMTQCICLMGVYPSRN
jgi:microcystin-dependent protein